MGHLKFSWSSKSSHHGFKVYATKCHIYIIFRIQRALAQVIFDSKILRLTKREGLNRLVTCFKAPFRYFFQGLFNFWVNNLHSKTQYEFEELPDKIALEFKTCAAFFIVLKVNQKLYRVSLVQVFLCGYRYLLWFKFSILLPFYWYSSHFKFINLKHIMGFPGGKRVCVMG